MSQTEFVLYRPLLFSIAYRMVGCVATAEDMVQDTFFNWLKTENHRVKDAKSYLIRSITNTCLNYLSSIRKKKEELIDTVSNSLPSFNFTPDFSNLDLKCEVTQALAQVCKKLAPAERAVFMLKGLFNFDYSEVTTILGRKSDNCRQLFSRAQSKLAEEKERFSIDTDHLKNMVSNFKEATLGEFSGLIDNLKNDLKQ
ncbi:MAG: sigma-70 family RNA polymerase sigma factor [Reichenbachiella sp.]